MKWLLLCCVSLCLVSCSYLTDFFIFNNSEAAITIQYKTKTTELYEPFVTAPKLYNFRTYKKVSEEISNPEKLSIQDSIYVTAVLQPKQALWIGNEINFSPVYDAKDLEENLDWLRIIKKSDTTLYSTENIAQHFVAYRSSNFSIRIE